MKKGETEWIQRKIQPDLQRKTHTNTTEIFLQKAGTFPVFLQSQYYPDTKTRQGSNKKIIII